LRTREQEVEPLINLSEITEVELLILKRMREFTIGEHSSMFHGTGFDFVGLRDWQAGDRFENIDWPQSSLTNFSPLVVREFEQPTTPSVIMVADRSASTRSGPTGKYNDPGAPDPLREPPGSTVYTITLRQSSAPVSSSPAVSSSSPVLASSPVSSSSSPVLASSSPVS